MLTPYVALYTPIIPVQKPGYTFYFYPGAGRPPLASVSDTGVISGPANALVPSPFWDYFPGNPFYTSTFVKLPLPNQLEQDSLGNVSFSWDDPLENIKGFVGGLKAARRLRISDVQDYLSYRVDQKQNRRGDFICITDPPSKIVGVYYETVDPWTGESEPSVNFKACVTMPRYSTSLEGDALTLIAYRVNFRFSRDTGVTENA